MREKISSEIALKEMFTCGLILQRGSSWREQCVARCSDQKTYYAYFSQGYVAN